MPNPLKMEKQLAQQVGSFCKVFSFLGLHSTALWLVNKCIEKACPKQPLPELYPASHPPSARWSEKPDATTFPHGGNIVTFPDPRPLEVVPK